MSTNTHNQNSNFIPDILRSLLAITIGILLSKYTDLSFNFQIPIIAFGVVTTMKTFSIKLFFYNYWWIPFFAGVGLLFTEIFRENLLAFASITFIIFFSCFFFSYKHPNGIRSSILGYSFTSIYATYNDKIVENMVTDIVLVTILGGLIGWGLLLIFPTGKTNLEMKKSNREDIHKNIIHILIITIIVFSLWLGYMFFDIRDTFFAYATLAGIYTNLNLEKIHKLSFLNIFIHSLGCFFAIIFSFFINGIGNNPIIFAFALMIFIYPMVFMGYYGKSQLQKNFFLGMIRAIILPICLYLTPYGDIITKASTRALQITIFLIFSMFLTRFLLFIEGGTNE
ncbi:hypothetical protein [uncultured Cetobacterium sp.]|uniref:hypothetical protein n=1 Tax=uncultured Cetobacterium sp. TaxID=527638 RepID=UPI00260B342F|nr:hypothetical protein [uncultured Cetobacterium sp.]